MIVVDASALLEVLLRTPRGSALEQRLFAGGESLHAPHLLDIEVAQVLRRYCAFGEIDDRRGREALDDLLDMPLTRYPHDFLLPRVWDLRNNATAYDAVYLALAEELGAPILTCDTRLTSVPGYRGTIELM